MGERAEPAAELERRVGELERVLGRIVAAAQAHPFGRRLLALAGLEDLEAGGR